MSAVPDITGNLGGLAAVGAFSGFASLETHDLTNDTPISGSAAVLAPFTSSWIIPPGSTVGELTAAAAFPKTFDKFLGKLGADASTPVDTLTCAAEEDLYDAIHSADGDGNTFNAMEKASVIRVVRDLFAALSLTVPALGAGGLPAATTASTAVVVHGAPPAPGGPAPASGLEELNVVAFRHYLDQSLKGSCPVMSLGTFWDSRAALQSALGTAVMPKIVPTREQLSCLAAVLGSGRAPFADFGVWPAFGPRKILHANSWGQVWRDGQLVSVRIQGPDDYKSWQQSWGLFMLAMLGLRGAGRGNLDLYSAGVDELHTLFPDKWNTLIVTDIIMRSERWSALRDEAERVRPAGYDPAVPWDWVIGAAAYGVAESPSAAWWNTHFLFPNFSSNSPAEVAKKLHALEGNLGNDTGTQLQLTGGAVERTFAFTSPGPWGAQHRQRRGGQQPRHLRQLQLQAGQVLRQRRLQPQPGPPVRRLRRFPPAAGRPPEPLQDQGGLGQVREQRRRGQRQRQWQGEAAQPERGGPGTEAVDRDSGAATEEERGRRKSSGLSAA